jgi:plasmid stabilization system protein ParE
LADLIRHYKRPNRVEAARNLIAALDQASAKIEADPAAGVAAPRPYPELARTGVAWVKAGRYWFAYGTTVPVMIVGVFHETADIPTRF